MSTLREQVERDQGLRHLLEVARAHEDQDPGHDLAHAMRVADWAVRLGGGELNEREVIAAALLHDAINLAKDAPERSSASVMSARLAREVLPAAGFAPDAVRRIAEAIEDHSYSRGATPRSDLGRALQDADRLEALGALGVLRTASCGARLGARYLHPEDPWARDRQLDDKRFTVDHFFVKLLRLEDTLTTEAGRAEARRRTAFMREFLAELGEEIGEPPDLKAPAR